MNIKNSIAALSVAAVVSISGGAALTAPAFANDGAVCDGLTSGKIDTTGEPQSVTITASAGNLITGYCVKAGSANDGDGPVYVTVDPPAASVTFEYPGGKAISHYSYTEAAASTPTPTPTETPTPTPTETPTETPTPTPTTPTQTPSTPAETPTTTETPSPEVSPSTANNGGGNTNDENEIEVLGAEVAAGNGPKAQTQPNQDAGTEVLGQQPAAPAQAPAQAAAPAPVQAAPVPTAVAAGVSSEANQQLMLSTSLAMLGALLALVAFATRRRV